MSLKTRVHRAVFAVALLGASLVLMPSATAQDAKGSPACAQLAKKTEANPSSKNFKAELNCEFKQIDSRITDANKRAANADKRSAQYRELTACYDFLTKGVTEGRLIKAEIFARGGGDINDGNVCTVAKHYGYGRGAVLMRH